MVRQWHAHAWFPGPLCVSICRTESRVPSADCLPMHGVATGYQPIRGVPQGSHLLEAFHRHHPSGVLVQTLPDLPVGACVEGGSLRVGVHVSEAARGGGKGQMRALTFA